MEGLGLVDRKQVSSKLLVMGYRKNCWNSPRNRPFVFIPELISDSIATMDCTRGRHKPFGECSVTITTTPKVFITCSTNPR